MNRNARDVLTASGAPPRSWTLVLNKQVYDRCRVLSGSPQNFSLRSPGPSPLAFRAGLRAGVRVLVPEGPIVVWGVGCGYKMLLGTHIQGWEEQQEPWGSVLVHVGVIWGALKIYSVPKWRTCRGSRGQEGGVWSQNGSSRGRRGDGGGGGCHLYV